MQVPDLYVPPYRFGRGCVSSLCVWCVYSSRWTFCSLDEYGDDKCVPSFCCGPFCGCCSDRGSDCEEIWTGICLGWNSLNWICPRKSNVDYLVQHEFNTHKLLNPPVIKVFWFQTALGKDIYNVLLNCQQVTQKRQGYGHHNLDWWVLCELEGPFVSNGQHLIGVQIQLILGNSNLSVHGSSQWIGRAYLVRNTVSSGGAYHVEVFFFAPLPVANIFWQCHLLHAGSIEQEGTKEGHVKFPAWASDERPSHSLYEHVH